MSKQRQSRVAATLIFIIALISTFTLAPTGAGAHGPQSVVPAYDPTSKILTVTVTHNRFSADHYINAIEISRNGKVVLNRAYKSQAAETFTYTFPIDAAAGDVLEVKAVCNKFGSRTGKITVGQAPASKLP
ncbi:MAG TPA: hypothetical protein PK175_05165 [Syntrophales bacterium]|jgi:desulfoferrodoxin (superoxide reductase-like protein)|nr:hypothetical protein [Syntrophales bacterium]HOU77264.1 hypothetical protein [Syntrophales bacterium]HQG34244.1 hypothetical protein [Syntrophales bacterium]HQI35756.1 hypothetical protein [Syntrophales bacterium]